MAESDTLQQLIDDGVIDEIHGRLMSGKEASVFIVERKGELIAAKVYKAREQRTFKATASYTEGRNQTRNSRDKRAMGKRTSYGRELIEENWRDMEFQALSAARAAGVRVPEPILLYDDVLLMELLVDDENRPAPRLADFELPADVAELLHREIYGQVRLLLAGGMIHGDLSAFNILIATGGPTLIDLPQVVDAAANSQAKELLQRDLQNVTEHLARFDARLLRFRDCGLPLYQHYQRGTLDQAIDPEDGTIRRDGRGGRRVRDAERGRFGRDGPPQPRQDGPRRDGPPPPPQQQQRHDGPRRDGPPQQQQRHDGPRRDGPQQQPQQQQQQQQQQRHDGPRRDGPPPPQQRRDGPPPPQQRHDGPRPAPRRDGPPMDQRRDGPPPRRDGPPMDQRRDGPPPRRDGPPMDQRRDGPPPRRDGPPMDQRRDGPPPRRDGPPMDQRRNGPPPRRHDDGPQRGGGPQIERIGPPRPPPRPE